MRAVSFAVVARLIERGDKMNAAQLTGLASRKDSNSPKTLERKMQIRCHLLCVRRQVSELHFDRIPFHVFGILRAIGS
jgi:hypothetical protein